MKPLPCYDMVEQIESWVKVGLRDRPTPLLTHFATLRLRNGQMWCGYLTQEQWRGVQNVACC